MDVAVYSRDGIGDERDTIVMCGVDIVKSVKSCLHVSDGWLFAIWCKLVPKKLALVKNSHSFLATKNNKPHQTTSQNGRNTTVRLPPPWRILAISWPKIMLRKKWSNQNGRQDPAPNMDKRRGAAQQFDHLRASLPDRLCYFSITWSSTWILMMIWWM